MIRPNRPDDLETLLGIWLEASSRAHDFVERGFWEARLVDMRNLYLPAAQTWVYERDGTVVGFVSLLDDVLAAIFVAPTEQGHGIGSALLEHAKGLRERLSLTVYAANGASIAFYRRHGFQIAGEQLDAHTGHPERVMTWQRQASVAGGGESLSS
ncbi:N-acetyltransferase [Pseudomonas stutzeri]|nr:N-acetyltransferase [Stutzerimonas stutzeri]